MNCRDVTTLLDLKDPDASLDGAAVAAHLESCLECARAWPEVAMLVGARAPAARIAARPRPRVRRKTIAAGLVAAAAIAIAASGARTGQLAAGRAPTEPARPITAVPGIAATSAVSRETVSFDRRIASRVTCTVWTAPMPKCLRTGGPRS